MPAAALYLADVDIFDQLEPSRTQGGGRDIFDELTPTQRAPSGGDIFDSLTPSRGDVFDNLTPSEQPKTSATGAFLRSAGAGVAPTAAFGTAFGAALPWATGLMSWSGPFAPLLGGIAAAGPGSLAAWAASMAQHKIAETVAPESTKEFDELSRADAAQHGAAQFAGGLASALPSMHLDPGTVYRGLSLLPALARGSATQAERQAIAQAAGRVGGGALFGAVTPLFHGELPGAKDVAEGAAFGALFGHPRWGSPGAAAGEAWLQRGRLARQQQQRRDLLSRMSADTEGTTDNANANPDVTADAVATAATTATPPSSSPEETATRSQARPATVTAETTGAGGTTQGQVVKPPDQTVPPADWLAAYRTVPLLPLTEQDVANGRKAPYQTGLTPVETSGMAAGSRVVNRRSGEQGVVTAVDSNHGNFTVLYPDGHSEVEGNFANPLVFEHELRPLLKPEAAAGLAGSTVKESLTVPSPAPAPSKPSPGKPIPLRPVVQWQGTRFYGKTWAEAKTLAKALGYQMIDDTRQFEGFETPDGKFLTRDEAKPVFEQATGQKVNGELTPDHLSNLPGWPPAPKGPQLLQGPAAAGVPHGTIPARRQWQRTAGALEEKRVYHKDGTPGVVYAEGASGHNVKVFLADGRQETWGKDELDTEDLYRRYPELAEDQPPNSVRTKAKKKGAIRSKTILQEQQASLEALHGNQGSGYADIVDAVLDQNPKGIKASSIRELWEDFPATAGKLKKAISQGDLPRIWQRLVSYDGGTALDQLSGLGDWSKRAEGATGDAVLDLLREAAAVREKAPQEATKAREQQDAEAAEQSAKDRAQRVTEELDRLRQEEMQKHLSDNDLGGTDIRLVDQFSDQGEGEPFAHEMARPVRGKSGKAERVEVRKAPYLYWLRQLARDEPHRQEMIKALVTEEALHLKVEQTIGEQGATDYWRALSGVERRIVEYRYRNLPHGRAPFGAELSESQLGHEAIRFRMQQLMRLTPREIAQLAGRERWSMRGLTLLETIIRGLRETFGGARAKELLQRVQSGLTVARRQMGRHPGAPELPEKPELPPPLDIRAPAEGRDEYLRRTAEEHESYKESARKWRTAFLAREGLDPTQARRLLAGKVSVAEMADEMELANEGQQDVSQEVYQLQRKIARERLADILAGRNPDGGESPVEQWRNEMWAGRQPGAPELPPPPPGRGRQEDLFLPPVRGIPKRSQPPAGPSQTPSYLAGAPEAAKPAPAPASSTPSYLGGPPPPQQDPLHGVAQRYLSSAPRPSFGEFLDEVKKQDPRIQPGLLRERLKNVWQDNLWTFLEEASNEQVNRLARVLGLKWELGFKTPTGGSRTSEGGNLRPGGEEAPAGERPGAGKLARAERATGRQPEFSLVREAEGSKAPERESASRKGKLERAVDAPALESEEELTPDEQAARQEERELGVSVLRTTPQTILRRNLIAAIGEKLAHEAGQTATPYDRATVGLDDVRYGTFDRISEADASDPAALGRILTAEGALNRQTKQVLIRSGERIVIDLKPPPPTVTRSLVLLAEKLTGSMELVSTFTEHGKVMIFDPLNAGQSKPNVELWKVLGRYRPVARMLVDEPVRNFRKRYKTMGEFNAEMGGQLDLDRQSVTRDMSPEEIAAHDYLPTAEEEQSTAARQALTGEELAPAQKQGDFGGKPRRALSAEEAGALLDHIYDELGGKLEDPSDVLLILNDMAKEPVDYRLINAVKKVLRQVMIKTNLEGNEALAHTLQILYEQAQAAPSREHFQRSILDYMGQRVEEGGPDVGALGAGRAPAAAPTAGGEGARELTMLNRRPPTMVAGAERGTGRPLPEGTPGPAAQPQPKFLTAEEMAAVVAQTEKRFTGGMEPLAEHVGKGLPMIGQPARQISHVQSPETRLREVFSELQPRSYRLVRAEGGIRKVFMPSKANPAPSRMRERPLPGAPALGSEEEVKTTFMNSRDPASNLAYYQSLYRLADRYQKTGLASDARGFAAALDMSPTGRNPLSPVLERAWDDAKAGRPMETDPAQVPLALPGEYQPAHANPLETVIMGGDPDLVLGRPAASQAADALALAQTSEAVKAAGLERIATPNRSFGGVEFTPDGFNHDIEGRKLIAILENALGGGAPEQVPYLWSSLLNTVRINHRRGRFSDPAGGEKMFSDPIADRLYQLTQSEASHYGLMLQSLQRFGERIVDIGRDVGVYLRRQWRSEAFGPHGDFFDDVYRRIWDHVATGAAGGVDETLGRHPELQGIIDRATEGQEAVTGGRVYRRFQQLMMPKKPKRLETMLADTRVQEAVEKLVQDAAKAGLKPIPRPGKTKLTPWEQLEYLSNPANKGKMEGLLAKAVREGERNAARGLVERRLGPDEMALYDARTRDASEDGPDPTPDEIAQGLATPEFRHWGKVFLGYDPVTINLVQRVLKGDFRGTRFEKPGVKAPAPATLKIDLEKLAKSPDAHVKEVFDHYLSLVEGSLDVNAGADVGTLNRVRDIMVDQLGEQLQKVRERIRDAHLEDRTKPGAKPLTPEERMLEAVHAKLFGDARLDTRAVVERLAGKDLVKRLLPKMSDVIKDIWQTPAYRQGEIKERFVRALVEKLGLEDSQAEKAGEVFEKSFADKFAQARENALAQVEQSLSPAERKLVPRSLWDKLVRGYRAGLFDSGALLTEIAKARGWKVPDDALLKRIRGLVDRWERLGQLPERVRKEQEAAGTSTADMEKLRLEHEDSNAEERDKVKKELERLWAGLRYPFNLPQWKDADSWKGAWAQKANAYRAMHEMATLGLITKVGFPVRIFEHLTTQLVGHALVRPMARVWELVHADLAAQRGTHIVPDLVDAYRDGIRGWAAAIKPALSNMRAELTGRGEVRNVDRLLTGVQGLERMAAQGRDHMEKWRQTNNPLEFGKGFLLHLWTVPRLMGWVISAVDAWQGVPAEYQDMLHRVEIAARQAGMDRGTSAALRDGLFKDVKARFVQAQADAARMMGEHPERTQPSDPARVNKAAWNLMLRRAYDDIERAGLPSGAIQQANLQLRRTLAWQDTAARGVGGIVGQIVKAMPLTFGAFGNAIAHSINYAIMWLPPPFHLLAETRFPGQPKEHSGWYATDLDRKQRMLQSLVGTAIGGYLAYLVFNGSLRVIPHFIASKADRDKLEKEGHKPGTVEIVLPDGSFMPYSLTVGPFQPMAPYLAAAGAAFDLGTKRAAEQQKLNERAAKLGIAAGQIDPPDAQDYAMIAGSAAWQTLLGSKTAAGWTQQFLEPGKLEANIKRTAAGFVQPFIPGAPAWSEIARMDGVALDRHLASFWDYLVPLPTSAARAVNALGDPVGTPNGVQRVIQTITAGTYPGVVDPKELAEGNAAYGALEASGYRPPVVVPGTAYNVNGTLRPLTDSELEKYTAERGLAFKGLLSGLGSSATMEQAQAALHQADAQALQTVGAERGGGVGAGVRRGAAAVEGLGGRNAGRIGAPAGAPVRRSSGRPSRIAGRTGQRTRLGTQSAFGRGTLYHGRRPRLARG